MKRFIHISALITLVFICSSSLGQISINGPACVTNNTVYMYTITGTFDSSHTWQLCVTGGTIDSTDSACVSGRWQPFVLVSWTSGSTGSMQLISDSSNAVLSVNVTTQLSGGTIDSSVIFQRVDSITTPNTITCSLPIGGGCSPVYEYQWQQSTDALQWTDINGATDRNLSFSGPVTQPAYFRREVKTTSSDADALSNIAAIFITN